MSVLPAWPLSAWLAVMTLVGPALAIPARALWRWFMKRSDRLGQREDRAIVLVELLRRALDKRLIRENGATSACDMLILAVEGALAELPSPQPAMERAIQRALVHLHAARQACEEIDRLPPP